MSELNLSTDETRVSYGIGRQLGGQLRDNPPPGVSLDAILAGLTDAFNGADSRVSEADLSASFKVIRESCKPKLPPRPKPLLRGQGIPGRKRQA
jgi:FKBP-type peptidyl-prolyl cis-trans isomerase FklB